ncbi:hypothetical protein AZ34_10320 [Hylemonella gracilis str. Niagara R]|uniref:Uncharacterized protein n=1 Tax=Hylemonella gracilis str. Niagara R TaxID=1458275 RepID=A0A016XL81_9BURK|nr:hypothetical protein [Hylemonella gracilis]EYC52864.1 hypothetical protein AZ34_10320 [Hylemonella gracilis str. Niagara R]
MSRHQQTARKGINPGTPPASPNQGDHPRDRRAIKREICTTINRLKASGMPPGWDKWDAVKTAAFKEACKRCNSHNRFDDLVAQARIVAQAYDLDPTKAVPSGEVQ